MFSNYLTNAPVRVAIVAIVSLGLLDMNTCVESAPSPNLQTARCSTIMNGIQESKAVVSDCKLAFDSADRLQASGHEGEAVQVLAASLCSGACLLHAEAWSSMGVLVRELKDDRTAISLYSTASRLEPAQAGHQYRLGNAFTSIGKPLQALNSYLLSTRKAACFGDAYNNMGNMYSYLTHIKLAERSYRHASLCDPKRADYMVNVAGMQAQSDLAGAVKTYKKALKIQPKFPEAYNNMANFLRDLGDLKQAAKAYKHALKLMPSQPDILTNLLSTEMYLCDWRNKDKRLKKLISVTEKQLSRGETPALTPFYAGTFGIGPELLLKISAATSKGILKRVEATPIPRMAVPKKISVLKIAFVSSDLTNHIVGHGIATLLSNFRELKHAVRTVAVSLRSDNSIAAMKTRTLANKFIDASAIPSPEVARQLNKLQVHAILELNGHTKNGRPEICAMRPGLFCSIFHGFAGTMGAPFVQGLIADSVVVPPELSDFYSESLLYMPETFFLAEDYSHSSENANAVLSAKTWSEAQMQRSRVGLSQTAPVAACFNSLYKIDSSIFSVWSGILREHHQTTLWLQELPAEAKPRLYAEAKLRNLSSDRLHFSPLFPRQHHLVPKSTADIFLDSPLYNAHTSAADALQSGVPLVTLPGRTMASRVAASISMFSGNRNGIVRNLEDYRILAELILRKSSVESLRKGRWGELSQNGCQGNQMCEWRARVASAAGLRSGSEAQGVGIFQRKQWATHFLALLRNAVDEAVFSHSGSLSSNVVATAV